MKLTGIENFFDRSQRMSLIQVAHVCLMQRSFAFLFRVWDNLSHTLNKGSPHFPATNHPSDVSPLSSRVTLKLAIISLQACPRLRSGNDLRFFRPLKPAPSTRLHVATKHSCITCQNHKIQTDSKILTFRFSTKNVKQTKRFRSG